MAQNPQGIHPDEVQGGGYVVEGLIKNTDKNKWIELTGLAGDVSIIHPFMLHRVSKDIGHHHRFISHINLGLKNPLNLKRSDGKDYSLLERSINQYLSED